MKGDPELVPWSPWQKKEDTNVKKVTLEKLCSDGRISSYAEQYSHIRSLIEKGRIRPVLASGTNGKKPALYREYWLVEEEKNYGKLEEELKYQITPLISVDYYLAHPDVYEKDRPWVILLNRYLKNEKEKLKYPQSVNERSFEIWRREKFLSREQGKKILKRCGLSEEMLNVYKTTEPLAYYTHTREVPQNLLILENKDTFYSMRRHLLEGNEKILGVTVGTLIYGAGKGIFRSFQDFELCVEPYMKHAGNVIYYFGDMDYEGLGIYESLAEMFAQEITPFQPAYEAMLKKAEAMGQEAVLPDTKEGQIRRDCPLFFSYFKEKETEQMKIILEKGKYIPQEILNISDL